MDMENKEEMIENTAIEKETIEAATEEVVADTTDETGFTETIVERTPAKKKSGERKVSKDIKKIIFNVAIALICVASILTLFLGDFLATDVKLAVKKDTVKDWYGKEGSSKEGEDNEANDVKTAAPESTEKTKNSEKKKSLLDGNLTSDEMAEMIIDYIPDDFQLELNVSLNVNGQTLAKSAVGQKTEAVQELIEKQVNSIVSEVDKTVGELIVVAKEIIVNIINDSMDDLKRKIREAIEKALAENNLTEEQLDAYLDKLGDDLTMNEVDDLIEFAADGPVKSILDGEVKTALDTVMDHATTRKILRTIAKTRLLEEKQKDLNESSKEELAAFFAEPENEKRIGEFVDEEEKKVTEAYEEYIPRFADENGKITSESLMVGLVNLLDEATKDDGEKASNAAEGEGEDRQIKSLDDVKVLIIEKINELLDEETMEQVGTVMSYVGYALFFFMACWLYVLIKVIVKTAFFRNKTVGLFFARFFGWMPHVFLVGIPMLILAFKDRILEAMTNNGIDVTNVKPYIDMISVNVHSLAWISALGTVVLTIMLFFYYPMRKEEKREKKAAKLAARQAA